MNTSSVTSSRRERVGSLRQWLWFAAVLFVITAPAQAQFAITSFTIDGGGGTSTNSQFKLTGTLGQPDAGGPMTGGQFSLAGGFWVLPGVVQSTNAPTLTITLAAPGFATLSWTPNTPGFVLQENLNLATTNWVNSPSGATNPIVVPATVAKKFYRLLKL